MKKVYLITAILFAIGITPSNAQRKKEAMPDEGYWVISHHKKTPKQCVVYYYNSTNDMIHQQSVTGRKLNIKRRKVVRELNSVLFQSLVVWNNKKTNKKEVWVARENQ